jgi:hypothetical protein
MINSAAPKMPRFLSLLELTGGFTNSIFSEDISSFLFRLEAGLGMAQP